MRAELMIGTGSISKMYTAVAALLLIDRGKFRIDDTLGRWFPATANVDPRISILQVLQNTSGLADYSAAAGFGAAVTADLNRRWSTAELLDFVGPPLFTPGTRWDASNTNRLLLGMIVELETGQSLASFLATELFSGLTSSWQAGEGTAPHPLAGQWFVDGAGKRTDYSTTLFGPSLFTARREVHASASDIAAFTERLFAGDLLTPPTRVAMLTIVPDDGSIAGQTGGGLGIRRYNYLGRTLYGHSGGTNNSSALVLFDPPTGIVAAVSINQNGPSHGQSHFRLVPALLAAAFEDARR
jgi:D-alanyl-D-alanine carboxypeptidase